MLTGYVLLAVSNVALVASARMVVPEENATLFDKWQALLPKDYDPIRCVVSAATALNMPTQTLSPDSLTDGKTRNTYRRSGAWLVKWRNEQRKAAADMKNLWVYRWEGSYKAQVAIGFASVQDLANKFLKRFGEDGEVRFTWLLSTDRMIVGIADDVLELGVAHLNLVTGLEEQVFIAGEGCFNCAFYPGQFVINFLSGSFTIPIIKRTETDPIAFQKQWQPVVKELWKFNGYPAEVKSVDYTNGTDMGNDALRLSVKRAEILRDDGRRDPGHKTKKAFCNNIRPDLHWMRHCVCKRKKNAFVSWCDKSPCDLDKCIPDARLVK